MKHWIGDGDIEYNIEWPQIEKADWYVDLTPVFKWLYKKLKEYYEHIRKDKK